MDWWDSWKDDFDRLPNDVLQIILHFRRTSEMVLTEERVWLMEEVREHRGRFQLNFLDKIGAQDCLEVYETRQQTIVMYESAHHSFSYVLQVRPHESDDLQLFVKDNRGMREHRGARLVCFEFEDWGRMYKHFRQDSLSNIIEQCERYHKPITYTVFTQPSQLSTFQFYPDSSDEVSD